MLWRALVQVCVGLELEEEIHSVDDEQNLMNQSQSSRREAERTTLVPRLTFSTAVSATPVAWSPVLNEAWKAV
jgi:hypothetical protein